MIYLDSPAKTLKIVLDAVVAANQLDISVDYFDVVPQSTTTTRRGGVQTSNSNSTSDVTISDAPILQGIIRNIHTLFVNNKDTATRVVTIKLDDGGVQKILIKQSLAAGDSLIYEDGRGWEVLSPITAPFVDTTEIVKGSLDATKRLRIEVDGITTGTTRVWTVADADIVVSGSAATMTTGRVVYTTTGGLLTSDSGFTYSGSTVAIAGALNVTGQLGLTAQVAQSWTGQTTTRQLGLVTNTGGALRWGLESSTGGSIFTGSSAYASVYGSTNATSTQFFANDALTMTFTSSGVTIVGAGTFAGGSSVAGDIVLQNAKSLRSINGAVSDSIRLIYADSSNNVTLPQPVLMSSSLGVTGLISGTDSRFTGSGAVLSGTGQATEVTNSYLQCYNRTSALYQAFTYYASSHTFYSSTSGTNTVIDTNGHVNLAATKKLFLDGGGDTYITEVSANNLQFVAGGVVHLTLGSNSIVIPATFPFYLDGGGDTYINESSANVINFVRSGSSAVSIGATVNINNALNYGGVTLSNAVTGTGNMVLSAAPTFTGQVKGLITESTEQATTSGTTKDFSSIPSGVKLIRIQFVGVSMSGNDQLLVQIGDAGGLETSGYISVAQQGATATSATNGFLCSRTLGTAEAFHGCVTLSRENSSSNTWVASGANATANSPAVDVVAGSKSLSQELDRLRLMTTGANTFDAGAVNIQYES